MDRSFCHHVTSPVMVVEMLPTVWTGQPEAEPVTEPRAGSQPFDDPYVGKTLVERYHVDALIGRGGMGCVYLGTHTRLERRVAIKVLPPSLAAQPAMVARLRREAQAAARLVHPNVASTIDLDEHDGQLFMVMELVDGVPLDELIARGPIDPWRAVELVRQIASALGAAHAEGIVHRDVKPSNAIASITRDGAEHVKVIDFGIAHLRGDQLPAHGKIMGTPAYLAPEQLTNDVVDSRTDVYALGCTLYELLTGAPPFGHGATVPLVTKHLHQEPIPPSTIRPGIPAAIDLLVLDMLAKVPAARPRDGLEVVKRIDRARRGLARGSHPMLRIAGLVLALDAEVLGDRLRCLVEPLDGAVARVVGEHELVHFATAEQALRAALAIRAEVPTARIAISHGELELGTSAGLFGPAANLALRMLQLAPPGVVLLAAEAVWRLDAASGLMVQRHGELRTPHAVHVVYRLRGAVPDPSPKIRGSVTAGVLAYRCACGAPGVAHPHSTTTPSTHDFVVRCAACAALLRVRASGTAATDPALELPAFDSVLRLDDD
jgi:hypothetical protein